MAVLVGKTGLRTRTVAAVVKRTRMRTGWTWWDWMTMPAPGQVKHTVSN